MNPLANTALIFSIGLMLMMVGAVNCKSIRGRLSEFRQWCKRTDYMDVLAVLGVLAVILVNWGWY